ncbi:hypothetical protein AB0M43_03970 [Longispora sp. NPDC051575]|uniref:hypothetical protein n=1 Tax=Longispora sp. NPDC051575 TaxID=3154943 RepID=UPI0034177871
MTDLEIQQEPWSPAHNPHAVAVSQGQWAWWTLQVLVRDARAASGTEQQIYARQAAAQLRDLHQAAKMQLRAITEKDVPAAVVDALTDAIGAFEAAVPGAREVRDMMAHFDEYARGKGVLQKELMRAEGVDEVEAARRMWGGGYDPRTDTFTEGPYTIAFGPAVDAARELQYAIYQAGRTVDAPVRQD